MGWVSSCTQANIISAIGEHNAVMFGYAKGMTKLDMSSQKFNCHKINEHVVGTSSKLEGQLNTLSDDLFQTILDRNHEIGSTVRQRVNFYHEILQAERESKMDLEYWVNYVVLFGVEHKIPLYDHMNFFKYLNIDVYLFLTIVLVIVYYILKLILCSLCGLCCKSNKKDDGKVKNE